MVHNKKFILKKVLEPSSKSLNSPVRIYFKLRPIEFLLSTCMKLKLEFLKIVRLITSV